MADTTDDKIMKRKSNAELLTYLWQQRTDPKLVKITLKQAFWNVLRDLTYIAIVIIGIYVAMRVY